MIYLDQAATSFPKPSVVREAVADSFQQYGANPGRGAYAMSLQSSALLWQTRNLLAAYFQAPDPQQIVFTNNTTQALNMILQGFLQPGDHVLYSSFEHNAVWRPLMAMADKGVLAEPFFPQADGSIDWQDLEQKVKPQTKLLVCLQASNVSGTIFPIAELTAWAHAQDICILVDAAQSAGYLPFSLLDIPVDFFAFPGHKGLYGPMGTGGFYVNPAQPLQPLLYGGTGSFSMQAEQPAVMPDHLESGTFNVPGIAGLHAALQWRQGQEEAILSHVQQLTQQFLKGVSQIPGIHCFGPAVGIPRAPVVSIVLEKIAVAKAAMLLEEKYQIAVRAGLHCAPLAHRSLGTLQTGTLRFSFGFFNTAAEIDASLAALAHLAKGDA